MRDAHLPRQRRHELAEAGGGVRGGRSLPARSRRRQRPQRLRRGGRSRRASSTRARRGVAELDRRQRSAADRLHLQRHRLRSTWRSTACCGRATTSSRPCASTIPCCGRCGHLAETAGVEVTYAAVRRRGIRLARRRARARCGRRRGCVAVLHASNVTGAVQPVEELAPLSSRCPESVRQAIVRRRHARARRA